MKPENFIEVSFEVANKVGGIHQVLQSKAGKMDEYYGDSYLTVGFYNEEKAAEEFAPRDIPFPTEGLEELEDQGLEIRTGVWRIPGQPYCILIDASNMEKSVDEIKTELYEKHGVDSINAGNDFDEPVRWSYAAGKVIEKLEEEMEGPTVVQLHEWLSSPALLKVDSPTVFTTHATVLGRALSNSDIGFNKVLEEKEIDDSLAEEHGVKAKHQLERTAAEHSDAFTTVSEVTGREAEAILGVKPDRILPNGFNVDDFPSLEELSYQHTRKKERMKEFLQAYFEPYYDVDLDSDPRILFISGRYEYHNKGLDVFIDALSRVNEEEGDDFFVFIFVPTDVERVKPEVLGNQSLFQELEDYVEEVMPEIRTRLLNMMTSDEDPGEGLKDFLEESAQGIESLQRSFHEKTGDPPTSAFDLSYSGDQILENLYRKGLRNREEDRVKVVFYPTYLSMGDKLLSMSYNDAIKASSAGIFPSYYEPWGYTPVETAASGALSVTTDKAGFGKFLLEKTSEEERKGIKVLPRENVSDEEAAEKLAEMIEDIVTYSKTEITERKHNARKLAQLTSWDRLGENYLKAHEIAMGDDR